MSRWSRLAAALATTCAVVAFAPSTSVHAGALPVCNAGTFAGGDGSVGDPYQVNSRGSLDEVRDCLDKHFIQTVDIDLGSTEWTPIGNNVGYGPNHFTGVYDGGDKNITGLSITIDSNYGIGLFGVSIGTVKNVHIAGSITLAGTGNFVGPLVGLNLNLIQHSSSSVTVSAPSYDYVGGLVGMVSPGGISDSSASGSVTANNQVGGLVGSTGGGVISTSFATGAVSGGNNVGGLTGFAGDSYIIANSYARGAVTATGTAGGFVGSLYLTGAFTNSYATGAVTAVAAGGFVGSVDDPTYHVFSGDVWDVTTTGRSGDGSAVGTTGYATADMKLLETFTGFSWDIDRTGTKVWQICAGVNDGYPFLTSEGRTVPSCTETEPTVPSTLPPTVPPTDPDLPVTGTDTVPTWGAIGLLGLGVALVVMVRRRRPTVTH